MGAAGLRGAWLSPLPVMVSGSLLRLSFPWFLGPMVENKGIRTWDQQERRSWEEDLTHFLDRELGCGRCGSHLRATWETAQGGR